MKGILILGIACVIVGAVYLTRGFYIYRRAKKQNLLPLDEGERRDLDKLSSCLASKGMRYGLRYCQQYVAYVCKELGYNTPMDWDDEKTLEVAHTVGTILADRMREELMGGGAETVNNYVVVNGGPTEEGSRYAFGEMCRVYFVACACRVARASALKYLIPSAVKSLKDKDDGNDK